MLIEVSPMESLMLTRQTKELLGRLSNRLREEYLKALDADIQPHFQQQPLTKTQQYRMLSSLMNIFADNLKTLVPVNILLQGIEILGGCWRDICDQNDIEGEKKDRYIENACFALDSAKWKILKEKLNQQLESYLLNKQ